MATQAEVGDIRNCGNSCPIRFPLVIQPATVLRYANSDTTASNLLFTKLSDAAAEAHHLTAIRPHQSSHGRAA